MVAIVGSSVESWGRLRKYCAIVFSFGVGGRVLGSLSLNTRTCRGQI
jgi:hypothetical protein